MTGHRSNPPADLKVVLQCPLNFLTEVNDCLIPALSDNTDSVVSEINIFDIKSDALGDTDPGSEKKRDKSEVALFCLFIVGKSFSLQGLLTVFNVIEKNRHLISLQSNYRSLVDLWHIYKNCGIRSEHLTLKEIAVEASQSR